MMKKYIIPALACSMALCVSALTSCSDVDLEGSSENTLDKVSNLTYEVNNKTVTLSWVLPAGDVKGVEIRENGSLIATIEGAATTYTVKNVETGVDLNFTVKAVYADGTVSEGITLVVNVAFAGPKSAYLVYAADVADIADDDEQASAAWFKKNYVDAGKGDFLFVSDLADLNPEIYSCLMVHIDRTGIGAGWRNLPGEVIANDVLSSVAAYVKAGGNLFLANQASQLVGAIGRIDEKYNPGIFGDGEGGDGTDYWTINPYLGYNADPVYDNTGSPLFANLQTDNVAYSYTSYPMIGAGRREDHNCCWDLNSYGFSLSRYGNTVNAFQKVTKSTVLATWGQVTDYAVGGLIDFKPTGAWKGRIVAMGLAAYEWNQNSGTNLYQNNIEKLTSNAFNYMSSIPEAGDDGDDETKVAYLVAYNTVDEIEDDDERASAAWFNTNYVATGKGDFLFAPTLSSLSADLYSCVWVHIDRVGIGSNAASVLPTSAIGLLTSYLKDGGNLFLTNHATQLVSAVGRIDEKYGAHLIGDAEGGSGDDSWTINPCLGYGMSKKYDNTASPLFSNLQTKISSGADAYDWITYPMIGPGQREDHNCMWDLNSYGFDGEDKVAAYQEACNCQGYATWGQVTDYAVCGLMEYFANGDYTGRIVAMGLAAYEWNQNTGVNIYQSNIEQFTINALNYLK